MNTHTPTTGIVIIVFHIEQSVLQKKIDRLGTDAHVAIVDNTPGSPLDLRTPDTVTYIPLGENTGIAHAQNVGIRHLVEECHCSHIVFFDQDSEFDTGYVKAIVNEYRRIEQDNSKLFMLGPKVVDKTNGEEYRSVIHKDKEGNDRFIPRREIISSGSCVSTRKLKAVGDMEDRLFIDYVDFEICWRAQDRGYVSGITQAVTLPHKVGSRELRLSHGYKVIISAPFRYYYQYRNYLWLCRRSYVPTQWKVATGIKVWARILYFPFCVNGWKEIEPNMWRGIRDGLFK